MALENYVKFLRGTQQAYNAVTKDKDTLYFISETDSAVGKLYLGEVLIAGNINADGTSVIDTLAELGDVNLGSSIADKMFLGYDLNTKKWIPMDVDAVVNISTMTGATATAAGTEGLVPAPQAGDEGKFLKGDGTWAEVPSGAQVFADIVPAEGQSHDDAIAAAVTGKRIQAGDIAVIKEVINGDKAELTAYSYDGEHWVALSGNYNAENVYFDEDITITMQVGNATVTNGAGVIPSKGKNLKQVFEALYAKEDLTLTVDWPSVSLSLDTSSVDKEVGDTFTRPTVTLKVTDIGSYEYGSLDSTGAEKGKTATGITFNKMKVGFGTDETTTDTTKYTEISAGNYGVNQTVTYTAKEADIASLAVTDAGASYKFFGTCDHTASPYKPRTNLGNLITAGSWKDNTNTQLNGTTSGDISNFESALGQITAKTLTPSDATFTVTGYRKWFTYVGNNTDAIDSAWIRTNCTDQGKGKKVSKDTLDLSVSGGTKRVVIALPTGKSGDTTIDGSNYNARVKSCIDVDGMGLDIFAAGKIPSQTVAVNDKSGANPMDYIVYVYENANGLAATTLKFKIN
jgi:hypothetical protein